MYSPSLNWTCLSLRKDQLLIASIQRWCSSLRNRCQSKSMSVCGAALDPSPAASFVALLERSFFGAIACKDTSIKVSLHELHKLFILNKQRPNNFEWCVFFFTKCKCHRAIRKQSYIGAYIIYILFFKNILAT